MADLASVTPSRKRSLFDFLSPKSPSAMKSDIPDFDDSLLIAFEEQFDDLRKAIAIVCNNLFLLEARLKEIQVQLDSISSRTSADQPASFVESAVRRVLREQDRSCRAFVRNLPEGKDEEAVVQLLNFCKADAAVKSFRLGSETRSSGFPPRPLIIVFNSQGSVFKFLAGLFAWKKETNSRSPLSARPDFSQEELSEYKAAWAEAIALNDEAGRRLYTVRDRKICKLSTPSDDWQKEQRKQKTGQSIRGRTCPPLVSHI